MSFFSEETTTKVSDHGIWVEKYRPDTIDGYICDDRLRDIVSHFIDRKDFPHLLFYGSAGTGKCLDYDELIDVEIEVTNDEYEILKKYEINCMKNTIKKFRIPIGELFTFFNLNGNDYDIPKKISRLLKIKTVGGKYTDILYLIKKFGKIYNYKLENGIEITCDENHLVKSNGKFTLIKDCTLVDTINGSYKIINSTYLKDGDVYDMSLNDPHEYITSSGIICHNTTLAKILTKSIPCDVMYVNASDNTGVDFVRDKIKPFASSMGFHDMKVIILDEADYMSANSQASLRNLMETYSKTTRFILTCNYVEKLIDPVISRSQKYRLEPPSMKDVAMYVIRILEAEKIKYEKTDVATVIKDFYPDVRKTINFIQQSSTSGQLKLVKTQNASFELKQKLIDLLKGSRSNPNAFNDIRQLVNDSGAKTFDALYSELYAKSKEYANGKETLVILDIAECTYQSSMVVDKEITFMACIAKIIKLIGK